ncbi:MAG: alpha-amylase family glycosyl hydrolase [Bacteroidota bacterium]
MLKKIFTTLKTPLIFCFLIITVLPLKSQIVSINPTFATSETNNVVLTFNADQGTAGLLGQSTIYAHTGVITNLSTSSSDWKYVLTNWTTNLPKALLTRIGTTNAYTLNIGNIRSFYGVPSSEQILKLAMVFRNADGSKEGKAIGGADIFVDINQGGFQLKINSPIKGTFYNLTDSIKINCSSSDLGDLKLYANGNLLKSVTNDSVLKYDNIYNNISSSKINLVLEGTKNGNKFYDTSYVINRNTSNVADLPNGTVDGINYINDTSVILQLFAPFKNYVYVVGDFNNWEFDPNYQMNKTPDGNRYWVRINGLKKGVEYGFQYSIDDVQMKVADIYADKVLDPFNDRWISNSTYPNLKPYPSGKTTEVVSVLETGQTPFNWTAPNFTKPINDKLVIYELLLRDFIGNHDFKTLKDTLSYLERLGVNCIQLMPIMEFEGNESWGYNPMFFFAMDKYYGTKNAFKQFVDECHKRKITVVLDIALNHSFGQNPQVRMYFDKNVGQYGQPTSNNPWFNQIDKHPYGVGYDYNHETQPTKDFTDRVIKYWLTEYKVDGYRFDLSKGFTQKNTLGDVGGWGAYDQSRVDIWNRIRNEIIKYAPDAYLILEHLGDNSEEKVLANMGFMLWGKMTENYAEANMGYNNSKADLSWGNYKNRQFTFPNLITYAESHDEERIMYSTLQFGNAAGGYNTKNLNTALKRTEVYHALLIPQKGPKMIWQGGELGYEVSINTNGRTGNKPFNWTYQLNSNRMAVYNTISKLSKLKQHISFGSDNYSYNVNGTGKFLKVNHDSMNSIIVGNFDVVSLNITPVFQHSGWWYNYMTNDSINITNVNTSIALQPGDFIAYTDVNLNKGKIIVKDTSGTFINETTNQLNFKVYPNPTSQKVNVSVNFENYSNLELGIYDIVGKKVYEFNNKNEYFHGEQIFDFDLSKLDKGLYFIRLQTNFGKSLVKLLLN